MTTVAPSLPLEGIAAKRRFPGIIGLLRFLLTGKWPVARDEDDSDHSRFADRLGRILALPMFAVFSVGALISVVQQPIQKNINAYLAGQPLNVTDMVAVFITLCLFGYGDITMVSAAGTLRDKIANNRPFLEHIFPSFLVSAIAILESAAFGGLIYLLEHPSTSVGWVSLIGRSAMGPLCVIWFAVTPHRIPTQDEMDSRFIYRLAMSREAILKSINLSNVNNVLFLPVIEQLRMWLAKDWNQESEQRLQEFMDMLKKLTPGDGAVSLQASAAMTALVETQERLAAELSHHQNTLSDTKQDIVNQFTAALTEMRAELTDIITSMTQERDVADVSMSYSVESSNTRPAAMKPKAGTPQFARYIHRQARELLAAGKTLTYSELATATGCTVDDITLAIKQLKDDRIGNLRPGGKMKPDTVLDTL